MYGVTYEGTGEAYYSSVSGAMLETYTVPGNNSAIFMLFNPVTNRHYLMFQMGDASGGQTFTTDLSLTLPAGSIITLTDDISELTLTRGT